MIGLPPEAYIMGCHDTCIHVYTIACGPEGSPPWCQGSREGGCGLVVEYVRDTWDGAGNTAVTVSRSEAEFITPAIFAMHFQID